MKPYAEAYFLQAFCLISHSGFSVAAPANAGVAMATASAAAAVITP